MTPSCQPGTPFNPQGSGNTFGADSNSRDIGDPAFPHQPVDLTDSRCAASTPVIRVSQRQSTRIQLQPLDRNGQLIQLPDIVGSSSSATPPEQFDFRLICDQFTGSRQHVFDILGTVVDADNMIVQFDLSEVETRFAGLFVLHLLILPAGETDRLLHVTPYWLEVAASALSPSQGPPTIAEIRMLMRDDCPDAEGLLGDYEFNDNEIALCITRPVDQFNITRPPLTSFTVATFPRQYRFYWTKATMGMLIRMAAAHKMRNSLQYDAGGISVNDKAMFAPYFQYADKLLAEWEAFILETKARMNYGRVYGVVPSDYGRALSYAGRFQ